VKSGGYEALAGLRSAAAERMFDAAIPRIGCWSTATNTVIFSIPSGDTQNLWEIGLSPRTGKVSGVPKRLTTGAGNEIYPSCASGSDGANEYLDSGTRDRERIESGRLILYAGVSREQRIRHENCVFGV
jgi:hypothetical protein